MSDKYKISLIKDDRPINVSLCREEKINIDGEDIYTKSISLPVINFYQHFNSITMDQAQAICDLLNNWSKKE